MRQSRAVNGVCLSRTLDGLCEVGDRYMGRFIQRERERVRE